MHKKTIIGAAAGTLVVAGVASMAILPAGEPVPVAQPPIVAPTPTISAHGQDAESPYGIAAANLPRKAEKLGRATADTQLSPATAVPSAPSQVLPFTAPPATTEAPPAEQTPASACAPGDETVSAGVQACNFHSAAMGRDVKVEVLPANKPNAPVLYVLDGLITFNDNNAWLTPSADLASLSNGDVNVVGVVAPTASFYTDWVAEQFGQTAKWETFLMDELPAHLEQQFQADTNTLGTMGMSMGGYAATNLAARHPDKVDAVYSLSGYYDFTDPLLQPAVMTALRTHNPEIENNMWGTYQQNADLWRANMPLLHADKLTMPVRLFTAGGGRPIDAPMENLVDAWVTRSPMETGSMIETNKLVNAMKRAGNGGNITRVHEMVGSHEWHTWKRDAHNGGFQWVVDQLLEAQGN